MIERSNRPARQRILARLQQFWKVVKAIFGIKPRSGTRTPDDNEDARLAHQIRGYGRLTAALVLPPALCLSLYVAGGRLLPATTDVDGLLRSILPAAALTAGLLAAGLMNATVQSKELRRRRVDALRDCQRELQPIRQAFDKLEISFNDRTSKGEHLTRFLEGVHRVGFEWRIYDGSDTGGRLMSVEKISDIVNALEELSASLGRVKHYRFLVEELSGRPAAEVNNLHGVVLTDWPDMMSAVERINPAAAAEGSWRYVSFWDGLINDTLDLATRTRELSIEVHHQNLTRLRAMFAHLAWLVVVGVAVPLVALAFPVRRALRGGLAMVAVGGMLIVLASSLVLLYRWITERRLHDEGRLEF